MYMYIILCIFEFLDILFDFSSKGYILFNSFINHRRLVEMCIIIVKYVHIYYNYLITKTANRLKMYFSRVLGQNSPPPPPGRISPYFCRFGIAFNLFFLNIKCFPVILFILYKFLNYVTMTRRFYVTASVT